MRAGGDDEQGKEVENIVWFLDEGLTKIDLIKASLGAITLLGIGSKVATIGGSLSKIGTTLQTIASGSVASIAASVIGIAVAFERVYENNEKFKESFDQTIQSIKDSLNLDVLLANFKLQLPEILQTIKDDFTKIFDGLSTLISYSFLGFLDFVNAITKLLTGDFKGALQSWGKMFEDLWLSFDETFGTKLFKFFTETIPNFFKVTIPNAWNEFTTWLSKIPTWLYNNVWVKIANFGINVFAELVNGIISAINGITESLSSIWDWTGIPAIPEIPKLQPTLIPMQPMANGGVVTSPTPALIGEYAGAKTNPEIVTPERLMREVFIDSMLPLVQAIVSGNAQVVQAIQENGQQPIELNGRKVSEAIYDDLRNVAIRKGNDLSFAR